MKLVLKLAEDFFVCEEAVKRSTSTKKRLLSEEVSAVPISRPQRFRLHSSACSGTTVVVSGEMQKKKK